MGNVGVCRESLSTQQAPDPDPYIPTTLFSIYTYLLLQPRIQAVDVRLLPLAVQLRGDAVPDESPLLLDLLRVQALYIRGEYEFSTGRLDRSSS